MQHGPDRTGLAHFGDMLAGFDFDAFGHQPFAVVRVSGNPFIAVLDDQQLAIADQPGPGIDHGAVRGGGDVLAVAAGDVDALIGFITGDVTADDFTLCRPLPGDVRQHRNRRLDRYRLADRNGLAQHRFLIGQCRRALGRLGSRCCCRRGQTQLLADLNRVGFFDAVPGRDIPVVQAGAERDAEDRITGLHGDGTRLLRFGNRLRWGLGGFGGRSLTVLAGLITRLAGRKQNDKDGSNRAFHNHRHLHTK